MPDQSDLFPDIPIRKQRGRPAPDQLTPPQMRELEEWAERVVPWLKREALESFDSVDSYVEEILEYWQGRGDVRSGWLATIKNRIRTVERDRLKRMARAGSEGARQALQAPLSWAKTHDSRARASRSASVPTTPTGLMRPAGGDLIRLGDRRRT